MYQAGIGKGEFKNAVILGACPDCVLFIFIKTVYLIYQAG